MVSTGLKAKVQGLGPGFDSPRLHQIKEIGVDILYQWQCEKCGQKYVSNHDFPEQEYFRCEKCGNKIFNTYYHEQT